MNRFLIDAPKPKTKLLILSGVVFLSACAVPSGARSQPAEPPGHTLGVDWEEVPGNPLLPPEECLSWNCAGVTDPTAVLNPDGSVTVWFTTMGIRKEKGQFKADGPNFGRASGPLTGKLRPFPDSPLVGPDAKSPWDQVLETPTVRRLSDGSLRMWYMGRPDKAMNRMSLGIMTARDPEGLHWDRRTEPIYRPAPTAWDSWLVTGPTVVQNPNGTWFLYYSGAGQPGRIGKQGIGLLRSQDGLHWEPYGTGPVLESRPGSWDSEILEQAVLYYKGQYWMWYSAYRGPLKDKTPISIGLATSRDGLHWTRESRNPVIRPGAAGTWNERRVLAPDVMVMPDGSLLMVAYGQSKKDRTSGSIGFWRSQP